MGRLVDGRAALLLLATVGLGLGVVSCASDSGPGSDEGFHYTMKRGDNLYRIGLRYGVDVATLIRANGIRDVHSVRAGTRLWIPGRRNRPRPAVTPNEALLEARSRARREARESAKLDFSWPLRGTLTSSYGRRRSGFHEGIDVAAKRGTHIRAAESGKVIHSGRLGDYGRVVIVKHAGEYRSVYAHARRLHVRKGEFVDKGQRIADVGTSGNASGPHLHFEIRRGESPRDPMLYLR